jgi:hypothetical protein
LRNLARLPLNFTISLSTSARVLEVAITTPNLLLCKDNLSLMF